MNIPRDETAAEEPAISFPLPRGCPFHEPDQYENFRSRQPHKVRLPNGRTAWLVTRHSDLRTLLTHPDVTADRTHPSFPLQIALPTGIPAVQLVSLVGMDPPQHTELRRALVQEFTVKRVNSLRARTQEVVDAHITALQTSANDADLVRGLAQPVISQLICELLGLSYRDSAFFITSTETILDRNADHEIQHKANAALVDYLDEVITEKERDPTDDLLGRLIVVPQHRDGRGFDHETVVGVARMLVVAGHEATPNMTSLGILALLMNADQLADVRAHPDAMPTAVDELLRFFSIADQSTSRVALSDIQIGGVTIRAGDGIIGLNAAANWDPDLFAQPDVIDLRREARRHFSFGFGPHQCLGQNLARMHLQIIFDRLFHRIPNIRLAVSFDQLRFKDDSTVYGLHELPVTW